MKLSLAGEMWLFLTSLLFHQSSRFIRNQQPEHSDEIKPTRLRTMESCRNLHGKLRVRHYVLSTWLPNLWPKTHHLQLHYVRNKTANGQKRGKSRLLHQKRRMGTPVCNWHAIRRQGKGRRVVLQSYLPISPAQTTIISRAEHDVSRGFDGSPHPPDVQTSRGLWREDRIFSDGVAGLRRVPVRHIREYSQYIGLRMLHV